MEQTLVMQIQGSIVCVDRAIVHICWFGCFILSHTSLHSSYHTCQTNNLVSTIFYMIYFFLDPSTHIVGLGLLPELLIFCQKKESEWSQLYVSIFVCLFLVHIFYDAHLFSQMSAATLFNQSTVFMFSFQCYTWN